MVRRHADWWNLPAPLVDRAARVPAAIGSARVSVQQMVGFGATGSDPAKVTETSTRRWGRLGPGLVCGDADELVEHFSTLAGQGAQRFYVWFADTAPPDAIEEFGDTVIAGLPRLSVLISDVIFSLWMSSVCHFGHESENFGRVSVAPGGYCLTAQRRRRRWPLLPPPQRRSCGFSSLMSTSHSRLLGRVSSQTNFSPE